MPAHTKKRRGKTKTCPSQIVTQRHHLLHIFLNDADYFSFFPRAFFCYFFFPMYRYIAFSQYVNMVNESMRCYTRVDTGILFYIFFYSNAKKMYNKSLHAQFSFHKKNRLAFFLLLQHNDCIVVIFSVIEYSIFELYGYFLVYTFWLQFISEILVFIFSRRKKNYLKRKTKF